MSTQCTADERERGLGPWPTSNKYVWTKRRNWTFYNQPFIIQTKPWKWNGLNVRLPQRGVSRISFEENHETIQEWISQDMQNGLQWKHLQVILCWNFLKNWNRNTNGVLLLRLAAVLALILRPGLTLFYPNVWQVALWKVPLFTCSISLFLLRALILS